MGSPAPSVPGPEESQRVHEELGHRDAAIGFVVDRDRRTVGMINRLHVVVDADIANGIGWLDSIETLPIDVHDWRIELSHGAKILRVARARLPKS